MRATARSATFLFTVYVLAAGVAVGGAARAQESSGKPCAGPQWSACEDPLCQNGGCGGRRVLCAACRARLASGRAGRGPLIPLAAQVGDTPFPRFHPVPTRPVFLPPWVGPPVDPSLPQAPQPPLLKHLPPAAVPEGRTTDASAHPAGEEKTHQPPANPGAASRPASEGWRARSSSAIRTSWLFHPEVVSRLEMEPREAQNSGRAARRTGVSDLLR